MTASGIDSYRIHAEPYYLSRGGEVAVFEAACAARLPVMLKGPTGCGKTRFVEHMAFRLRRPLITVACHEDLFASDLVGRYLLQNEETVWMDGPLTLAVRAGAICYLDEVVEARKDTTVVIHPLTDNRRRLVIDKTGENIPAHPDFMMVISYNPGYQSVLKDLKQSTRQRFVSLDFDYPEAEKEAHIVSREGGVIQQEILLSDPELDVDSITLIPGYKRKRIILKHENQINPIIIRGGRNRRGLLSLPEL